MLLDLLNGSRAIKTGPCTITLTLTIGISWLKLVIASLCGFTIVKYTHSTVRNQHSSCRQNTDVSVSERKSAVQ